MTNEKNLVISLRRHAETIETVDCNKPSDREVVPKGALECYNLGIQYRDVQIAGGFSSPQPRAIQTLDYFMVGAMQHNPLIMHYNNTKLDEIYISPEFRKIAASGNRNRNERIHYFLTHSDPIHTSTTPLTAGSALAQFVNFIGETYNGAIGRIEAITHGPKLESFLECLYKDAFFDFLHGAAFDNLEGIELQLQGGEYKIVIRDNELVIPEARLKNLALGWREIKWNG